MVLVVGWLLRIAFPTVVLGVFACSDFFSSMVPGLARVAVKIVRRFLLGCAMLFHLALGPARFIPSRFRLCLAFCIGLRCPGWGWIRA